MGLLVTQDIDKHHRCCMKAMIFAAGLGTRLKPLTDTLPKALVTVDGKPMLLHAAEKLMAAGVRDIIVNVHHHAGLLKTFVAGLDYPGIRFHISDETGQLMDTGGGLKKAAGSLKGEEAFFLYNADILCEIDLDDMLKEHRRQRPIATLAVSRRQTPRNFLWHEKRLAGWEDSRSGDRILCTDATREQLKAMAFSGIHLVEPHLLDLIREEGPFPITRLYLRLAKTYDIMAYEHKPGQWADIGTPDKLERAREMVKNRKIY